MVEVGKKYQVFKSRYVKVVKVTDRHIEVVHAVNGQTPVRQADRFFPLSWEKHFTPYPLNAK